MKRPMWLTGPLLCLTVLLGSAAGAEPPQSGTPFQETPSQAGGPAVPPEGAPIDSAAMGVLKRMADTLARARAFSVTMNANYDVVQDTGEKIEFGERRNVTLERPAGLRVEAQESDGRRTLVMFDGKNITMSSSDENVYGQIDKAGTVDDAVRHLVRDLQVRLPMALLLVGTLPEEIERRVLALDYVERNMLTPVPTDHLVARTADVDFQVWISTDDTPLPQRITITYKQEEGQPQYRADFADWELNPDVPAEQFAFRPAEGAERIPVLIRVRRMAGDRPPPAETAPRMSGEAEEVTK
jgi:hypothetical protein